MKLWSILLFVHPSLLVVLLDSDAQRSMFNTEFYKMYNVYLSYLKSLEYENSATNGSICHLNNLFTVWSKFDNNHLY